MCVCVVARLLGFDAALLRVLWANRLSLRVYRQALANPVEPKIMVMGMGIVEMISPSHRAMTLQRLCSPDPLSSAHVGGNRDHSLRDRLLVTTL